MLFSLFACSISASVTCTQKVNVSKTPNHTTFTIQPHESYCIYSEILFTLYSVTDISKNIRIDVFKLSQKSDNMPLHSTGYSDNSSLQFFSKQKYSLISFTNTEEEEKFVSISYVGFGENECSYGIIATNKHEITFETSNPINGIPLPFHSLQTRCIFLNGGVDSTLFSFTGNLHNDSISTFSGENIANSEDTSISKEFTSEQLPQVIQIVTSENEEERNFSFSLKTTADFVPLFTSSSEFKIRESSYEVPHTFDKKTLIIIMIVIAIIIIAIIITIVLCCLKVKRTQIQPCDTVRYSDKEEIDYDAIIV